MGTDSDSESDNFDDWSDQDDISCRSLFDTKGEMVFDSPKACLEHDLREYSFDVKKICSKVGHDDITLIKLVNFVRGRVIQAQSENIAVSPEFAANLQDEFINNFPSFGDDEFMIPVDREDPLLYLLSDALNAEEEGFDLIESDELHVRTTHYDKEEVERLKDELSKCKALLQHIAIDPADTGRVDRRSIQNTGEGTRLPQTSSKDDNAHGDNYYFEGYSHLSIHETMLQDEPRTSTYQASLMKNGAFVKGKVVLDVGCGTGILSIFAAQAGARRVIGVDSSNIIESARQIVARNGFSDKVTLIKGRLEEIELPGDVDRVDIIVSEWMGYALYFENMLSSVLFARDKWLNQDTGLLMPNKANIYVEAASAEGNEDRVGFWRDVYGVDMSNLEEGVTREAQVQYIEQKYVVSNRCETHVLEISAAKDNQLDFESEFRLELVKKAEVNCFVLSFDVIFNGRQMNGEMAPGFEDFVLSTGCNSPRTHWKQTVLWLKPEHRMKCEEGTAIIGKVHYQRSETNPRDYLIVLTWEYGGRECTQLFKIEA